MGRKRLAKNRGFPPNLYQNPAGYFYYINPQSKKQKGLGRDRANAFSEARAANAALATMAPAPLADWVLGKVDYTLTEWLPIYKAAWAEQSEKPPAAATMRSCTMYVKRLAMADFAWMRVREITVAHCADFIDAVKKESGSATAIALRARMGDVFRMAETKGLIKVGENPITATYAPSRTVKRERLSLEQFRAIREHAQPWLQRAMDLALVTAQRRDDVAEMKWADWKDGHLHIVQGKGRGAVKLRQDGRIRLAKVGLSIAEAIQNCRDLIVSPYIVHHAQHRGRAKPGQRLSANGLSNAFQMARDEAGITASEEGRTPPSFHEIRSLAERLYKEEFGAAFAQAMLGHKNASMTEKYDDLRGGWLSIAAK
jgi:integrase